MKVKTAINRIYDACHDIASTYDEYRMIEFLNNSIQQVSALLIAGRYPALVQEVIVHDGDTLPQNYMQACGTYPLRMTAGAVEILDGSDEVKFRYFANPPLVSDENDDLPYKHDAINEVIVRGAIILAANEDEYDISQDANLLNTLQQAIASGMQGNL